MLAVVVHVKREDNTSEWWEALTCKHVIAIFRVTSPVDVNMPIIGLLVLETTSSFVSEVGVFE